MESKVMRIFKSWSLLLVSAPILMVAQIVSAQEPTSAPTTDTSTPMTAATQTAAAPAATVPAVAPAKAMNADKKGKAKKVEYTGPTNVIVLPATPMLDEEGRQRLDPDGQPMFNPPAKQQRDKKGHPQFEEAGKPVFQTASELGYDERGKKLHAVKVKEPKMIPVSISRGTFTVDGMIGKAELNYDIADLKFIYLYAPGIGTLVVSKDPFPGAKEQKDGFNDKTLTVTTGEHKLQVGSDKRLLGKKPESAFVLVDRDFRLPSKYPVVGYGKVMKAPYVWPGGRPNEALAGAFVAPPPLPSSLEPVLLLTPCPAGQMRKSVAPVLPGQVAPERPCVAMPKGQATTAGPSVKGKDAVVPAPAPAPAVVPVPAPATPPGQAAVTAPAGTQ
jgi:hypothetical protein